MSRDVTSTSLFFIVSRSEGLLCSGFVGITSFLLHSQFNNLFVGITSFLLQSQFNNLFVGITSFLLHSQFNNLFVGITSFLLQSQFNNLFVGITSFLLHSQFNNLLIINIICFQIVYSFDRVKSKNLRRDCNS